MAPALHEPTIAAEPVSASHVVVVTNLEMSAPLTAGYLHTKDEEIPVAGLHQKCMSTFDGLRNDCYVHNSPALA